MTVILSRQRLKTIHKSHSFIPIYHIWEREMIPIQIQLSQLRTVFEQASFMLSKRDFERLELLELSQISLQKRLNFIRLQVKGHYWPTHNKRKSSLELMAIRIELDLKALLMQLAMFKRDKFEKKKKYIGCL